MFPYPRKITETPKQYLDTVHNRKARVLWTFKCEFSRLISLLALINLHCTIKQTQKILTFSKKLKGENLKKKRQSPEMGRARKAACVAIKAACVVRKKMKKHY